MYETKRKQITEWIENNIIPKIKDKELSYEQLVNAISIELGCTPNLIKEVFEQLVRLKKLNLVVKKWRPIKPDLEKQ
ncbi:hypothetical protein GF386_04025 [Candidatus Pacearchaeota archaeon]|nr:hypothetical protein [Candidatus Pacearchaeota archaeon]